jgi:thiamine-phosphate pyrophosphorylase
VILHALVGDPAMAETAAAGGATVIQLRLKGLPTPELVERGRPVAAVCARHAVTFVVNDDVAAAIELGADGVHLGRGDEGFERAREAGLLVGLSAQSVDESRQVDRRRPDYIGAGPVWTTPTKPDAPAIGLEALRDICGVVSAPVIAIGGIDVSNAAACLAVGAAGVAVVRAAVQARALREVLARAAV